GPPSDQAQPRTRGTRDFREAAEGELRTRVGIGLDPLPDGEGSFAGEGPGFDERRSRDALHPPSRPFRKSDPEDSRRREKNHGGREKRSEGPPATPRGQAQRSGHSTETPQLLLQAFDLGIGRSAAVPEVAVIHGSLSWRAFPAAGPFHGAG